MKRIPVAFATSRNMTSWLAVALTSLAENTKSKIDLHIIEDDLSRLDVKIIEEICKKHKNLGRPRWHHVNAANEFAGCGDWTGCLGAWIRFKLPDLLPDHDKILYFDSDLIFMDDIKRLYDIDMGDFAIAAPPEIYYRGSYKQQRLINQRKLLGCSDNHIPFCTGIMIFGLDIWRKDNLLGKLKEIATTRRAELYSAPDQNAMNILFADNYKEIDTALAASTFDIEWFENEGKEHFDRMQQNIIVHHFNLLKPWKEYLCDGIPILHRELFWYYAQKTPFAEYFQMEFAASMHEKTVAEIKKAAAPQQ
jgi:lipopolysaccharide biosynthesis glycosyltransferase